MNEAEKKLLTRLQEGIPLEERPFHRLGADLDMPCSKVIELTQKLFSKGIIRQISPIFEAEKLGYCSTLVAVKVAAQRLDEVADFVSSHPGVTHNYSRSHEFNLWFTLTLPESVGFEPTLEVIKGIDGVADAMNLSKARVFKIRAAFDLLATPNRLDRAESVKTPSEKGPGGIAAERGILIKAVRSLQRNLPLVEKPFDVIAQEAGMERNEFLELLGDMCGCGIIRRYPAVTRHAKIGFTHNSLLALRIPSRNVENIGLSFARMHFVTHCYERKTYPQWKYNLYAMTHARSKEESSANTQTLLNIARSAEHLELITLKEYKKTRAVYFDPELDRWYEKYGASPVRDS